MSQYHRLNVNEREEISLGIAHKGAANMTSRFHLADLLVQFATKLIVILNMGNNTGLFKPNVALIDWRILPAKTGKWI